MKFIHLVLFSAAASNALGMSSSIFWHCMTQYASTTTDVVSRTTFTRRITGTTTVQLKITPTHTSTPATSTQTSTVSILSTVSTTLSRATDTSTSTVYFSSTATSTADTTTITSSFSTSTVSTSTFSGTITLGSASGFLPIQSSLPSAAARKRGLSRKGGKKAKKLAHLAVTGKPRFPNVDELRRIQDQQVFPEAVTCYRRAYVYSTKTRTLTAKTVTTTLPTPIETQSTSTTITITNTVMPVDAQTTVTDTISNVATITVTPSTTISTTTTTTITAQTATASTYAMCLDQTNFAGSINGHGIYDAQALSLLSSYNATEDSTALGCCNTCASNPLCGFSAFLGNARSTTCLNAIVDSAAECTSQSQHQLTALYNPHAAADTEFTLSNGNCAEFTSGIPTLNLQRYDGYYY